MSSPVRPVPSEWLLDEEAFKQKLPYSVVPTNLKGVYSVPAPSDDFDPNTASQSDLIKNGILWRRPTASDPQAVKEAWDKVFSRKWLAKDRVVPVFEQQVGRQHYLRKPLKKAANGSYIGGVWAGAGIFSGGPYSGVIGYWNVPTVSNASEPKSSSPSYDLVSRHSL